MKPYLGGKPVTELPYLYPWRRSLAGGYWIFKRQNRRKVFASKAKGLDLANAKTRLTREPMTGALTGPSGVR